MFFRSLWASALFFVAFLPHAYGSVITISGICSANCNNVVLKDPTGNPNNYVIASANVEGGVLNWAEGPPYPSGLLDGVGGSLETTAVGAIFVQPSLDVTATFTIPQSIPYIDVYVYGYSFGDDCGPSGNCGREVEVLTNDNPFKGIGTILQQSYFENFTVYTIANPGQLVVLAGESTVLGGDDTDFLDFSVFYGVSSFAAPEPGPTTLVLAGLLGLFAFSVGFGKVGKPPGEK
jgi:hypothetical protein